LFGAAACAMGCALFPPCHITAAVYVNDHESGLIEDIGKWLESLRRRARTTSHHQTARTTETRI